MRRVEQCLGALVETSMTGGQKVTLLARSDDIVFGDPLREAADDSTIDAEFVAAQLQSGAFPRLAEVFGDGRICAEGDRLDQGLRKLLGGKPHAHG
jgi:hypothetical protein